jgi:DNA-3-methyladenine glycosylase
VRIVDREFFNKRAEELAPLLLGKYICRNIDNKIVKSKIVEVEAYTGMNDTACHSSRGKTPRTKVMWEDGGTIYVYFCYGIHYMLNIVCGGKNNPEAVLIRGVEGAVGPGRVTKMLRIDKSLNGRDIVSDSEIWLEEGEKVLNYKRSPRIGIAYASQKDREALLRFFLTVS